MTEERDLSLLEALDHLLDRGVTISGHAIISIGGVDLIYLGLSVVLASVDTLTVVPAGMRRTIEGEADGER
jgi:gas vesicle structural protein